MFQNFLAFVFLTLYISGVHGQNIFKSEVETIKKKYETLWNKEKETIVFTGSSSIRMWKNVDTIFPNHQIINTGFGGSQGKDLLFYMQDLVLDYNPTKIFIYEGDNDISSGQKPKKIRNTFREIINQIELHKSATDIFIISTKPSITRWHLKKEYKRLNKKLKRLCRKKSNLVYIDVWKPMLLNSELKKELFLSDGLHMNSKGYHIWYNAVKEHLK